METHLKDIKNIKDLQLLYYRYKDTSVFSLSVVVLILLVSFVLLGQVIIPQVQNWLALQEEAKKTEETILSMQEMQAALSQQTESSLNNDFVIASAAVPIEKDVAGILTAIGSASTKAGVSLDDFSFQVGDLSTKSAELKPQTSLTVSLTLKGDLESMKSFLREIAEKVPLSEVVSLDFSDGNARVDLLFFYSLLPDKVPIIYSQKLPVLTEQQRALLRQIEEWKEITEQQSTIIPVSSTSGVPEPF